MNIFNFDVILEQWAKAYRPLSHSSIESDKHKTFFRIGELKNSNEWNRNFSMLIFHKISFIKQKTHIKWAVNLLKQATHHTYSEGGVVHPYENYLPQNNHLME